ncbi:MAG TPA: YifB family Mg chelatase-like AAA ATPase [Candidatus Enterenecus merdae]|nr:YifB family Mg chelatase-like AAA ATPase [Candidatus Enterenecus merdae]
MVCKVLSLGLHGVSGYLVEAECALSSGLPAFDVVGLPDAAVKEARERVRAAIRASGFDFPVSRITVNLAPADRKKAGTVYDLPILVGILAASGQIKLRETQDAAFLGELSLSGNLRPVSGVLPMALAAQRAGLRQLFVPADNAPEATLADGLEVYPVETVADLAAHLRGERAIRPAPVWQPGGPGRPMPDFRDVKGQEEARRALEVAAAGGHHVLLSGSPGSGKSMMAKRLPSILPSLTRAEALECTEIYSVLGLTSRERPMVLHRPFRAPHHTVSQVGLSGGGTGLRPGEISMAHNGVLFLDELPEFDPSVLEVLRQPLEDGQTQITRVSGSVTYPSRFMLVCAMNPCRCGWYGHPSGRCTCTQQAVARYLGRLSGPLLDRIDICVEVPALEYEELAAPGGSGEPSAAIRERVNAARAVQAGRFGPDGPTCNAQMGPEQLQRHCRLDEDCQQLIQDAYERLGLTARSYDRVLRVARTIADLDGAEKIGLGHLAEALQYRPPAYLRR